MFNDNDATSSANDSLKTERGYFVSFILLIAFILILIASTIWKSLLLFLFPGILLLFSPLSRKFSFSESIIFSIFLSLSYWISGFWLLKLVPIPFTSFIFISVAISSLIVLFRMVQGTFEVFPRPAWSDVGILSLTVFLLFLFAPLSVRLIAPPGQDMSMHGYAARLIQEKNTFPKSYEPIVPIRRFGSTPFGFSVSSAAFSLLENVPVYRSTLFLTWFTYVLFGIALFLFLNTSFPLIVSALTTLTTLFLGINVIGYIDWGGNPTILSLAFLLIGTVFGLRLLEFRSLKAGSLFLLSVLLYASFTIHHIPFIVMLFLILFPVLYSLLKYPSSRKRCFYFFGYTFLFLFLLALPFLSSLKFPSSEALGWTQDWQRNSQHSWIGTLQNAHLSIPLYVKAMLGDEYFFLVVLGLFFSFFPRMRHTYWFFVSLIILFVLILNSRYWFLPLSPLLYPERVVTFGVILFSYFISAFFAFFLRTLVRAYHSRITTHSSMLIFFFVFLPSLVVAKQFFAVAVIHYRQMLATSANQSPVTIDDLRAFSWIAEHTSINDVFLNDYNDASMWIPAIAYRKIIVNQASPYDFDELSEGTSTLIPSYIYIGSKNISDFSSDFLLQQAQRRSHLVFFSGEARVYQIRE